MNDIENNFGILFCKSSWILEIFEIYFIFFSFLFFLFIY